MQFYFQGFWLPSLGNLGFGSTAAQRPFRALQTNLGITLSTCSRVQEANECGLEAVGRRK